MAKNKFINEKRKSKYNSRFIVNEPEDYNRLPILFSLERAQPGNFSFTKLNPANKSAFAEAIFKRRNLTWNEIQQTHRHKLGYEKISISAIKRVNIPKFITEDNHTLIAFRYNEMKAMVGYRIKNIFYVLWFDRSFKLYDH